MVEPSAGAFRPGPAITRVALHLRGRTLPDRRSNIFSGGACIFFSGPMFLAALAGRSRHSRCLPARLAGSNDESLAGWFPKLFQPDTSIFAQSRQYSTADALKRAQEGSPVQLKDLSRKFGPNVPITSLESPAYRIFAFVVAFLAYPGIVRFLRTILQLKDGESSEELSDVVQDFVTVETFVFGSYSSVTLTLQIQRLAELQTNAVTLGLGCRRSAALRRVVSPWTSVFFSAFRGESAPC